MTKLEIFIDFESISAPFNRKLKLNRDFPYAYTLGIYKGKKFKTRTFIFNFNKESIEDVDQIIRTQILRDIRTLTSNKTFKINKESSKFVSFAPSLERKLLKNIYQSIEVYDISFGKNISLSNATSSFLKADEYFIEFKKWVDSNIDKSFISKRGLIHDGALASLAGHILMADALNLKTKYYTKQFDIRTLVKEIAAYSKDDVVRMKFIREDTNKFLEVAEKIQGILAEKNKARKEIRKLNNVVDYIRDNKSLTLEELKDKLKCEISKQEKKVSKSLKP